MKTQTPAPFVDTTIIPDRNAGIGSLLWDLQNPQDPDRDRTPLLDSRFALIDVGVSRAKVATALKTLLASDLQMDVAYVATERDEAVPYANVTPLGDGGEKIRRCLSGLISSSKAAREVSDWHCVVDAHGKVSCVAYSYAAQGNEIWESYFMGRTFMYSGQEIEFADPMLDAALAPAVVQIEAKIDLERKRDSDPNQPGPCWDGYRIARNPLQTGLAQFGIALQQTDVPRRIAGRQNVLFLGNVLNHYPQHEQAREFDRIAAGMEEGDIVIVQSDEDQTSSIEVLQVKGRGGPKTRARVRWIDTQRLEVRQPGRSPGSWQDICVKPGLDRMVSRLVDCLGDKVSSPAWTREAHQALLRQGIGQVFMTFFRALPVEATLRIAIREALRRLPPERGVLGMPVFEDDATDAYGGALGLEASPIVAQADFIELWDARLPGGMLPHAYKSTDVGDTMNNSQEAIISFRPAPGASLPRSKPTVHEQTNEQPETGSSSPRAPSVTITAFGLRRITELREGLGLPVKGLRVKAIPCSSLRANFSLSFVPAEEPESPVDSIQSVDGIDLYVDADSAPYLEGASIDYVFKIIGSELLVAAPPRKLDTPEGLIAAKIHKVIEEQINPSLASHGGAAILIEFKNGIVFLELSGGCQGCSSAGATMKHGIETSLRERVPEVQEVRDVTRHELGRNPYFQQ